MFLFGHLGITLGAAVLGSGAYNVLHDRFRKLEKAPPVQTSEQVETRAKPSALSLSTWIKSLNAFLDIRLLLLGSMLPDIIDKPVGDFIFRSTFHNGRIFSHTLVFLLMFLILGLWLYWKRKKTWLLALAVGVLSHLILDFMWLSPQTLFWPLYGWRFPGINDSDILGTWLTSLIREPTAYIPEIVGLVIVACYGFWLLRRRSSSQDG